MIPTLPPHEAWLPLSPADWNEGAARHLLRRAAWTARPEAVAVAHRTGLDATLDRLFPVTPPAFAKPRLVTRFEEGAGAVVRQMQGKTGDERLRYQRELQERSRVSLQELAVKWLDYAAQPETAAFAKWVLFLSDVYVVAADKVRNASSIFRHFDILGRHGLGPAPALTKAVSRSPAMIAYLDLGQSQLRAPNENFARELFELFVLGEGNYTERDIKEAARAFTGYRSRLDGEFRFDPRQQDRGPKTLFGETAPFDGDGVVDLAYRQPAAARFLPREMGRYYLTEQPLPDAHLAALGDHWRAAGFELRRLLRLFFGSRIFFAPEYRGRLIKSPVQFYLGLIRDLDLQVAPLPRLNLSPLRQMGQALFYPPNVRGWVGGRQWINSSTLTARRQLVDALFSPLDERTLNADEQLELLAARTHGADRFTVPSSQLEPLASLDPAPAASALAAAFFGDQSDPAARRQLEAFLAAGGPSAAQRQQRVRRAAITLLQSPAYQLC